MPRTVKEVESYARLLDGSGNALSSTGGVLDIGFSGDVTSATHDSFNVNANLQVNDTDLALGQATKVFSLPVTLASDEDTLNVSDSTAQTSLASIDGKITACDTGSVTISSMPTVGTEANASSGQLTSIPDEPSTNSIAITNQKSVSAFGSVSQACDVTLEQSADDISWYPTGLSYSATTSDSFYINGDNICGGYVRLVYSASGTTVTATICAK